ncbi:hypothetical protein MMC12_002056 [Toensbergia leucococca]|nr:hypothetical protein [Toensbergia leucococca]
MLSSTRKFVFATVLTVCLFALVSSFPVQKHNAFLSLSQNIEGKESILVSRSHQPEWSSRHMPTSPSSREANLFAKIHDPATDLTRNVIKRGMFSGIASGVARGLTKAALAAAKAAAVAARYAAEMAAKAAKAVAAAAVKGASVAAQAAARAAVAAAKGTAEGARTAGKGASQGVQGVFNAALKGWKMTGGQAYKIIKKLALKFVDYVGVESILTSIQNGYVGKLEGHSVQWLVELKSQLRQKQLKDRIQTYQVGKPGWTQGPWVVPG